LYITLTAITVIICSLIENLRLYSSADAGIVLNLFLNLSKNEPRVFIKLLLEKIKSVLLLLPVIF